MISLPGRRLPLYLGLVLLLLVGATRAWADDDHDEARNPRSRLEGTWFCDTFVAPGLPINQTQILLTAGPRGTINMAQSDDMTGLNPSLGAQGFVIQTSGAGGWRSTGGRTFDLNYLQLGFTGIGPDAGLLSHLTRFRCAVTVQHNQFGGACDVDLWFGSDPDGDGIPNSPNPATTEPDFSIPDVEEMVCTRIPVVGKQ